MWEALSDLVLCLHSVFSKFGERLVEITWSILDFMDHSHHCWVIWWDDSRSQHYHVSPNKKWYYLLLSIFFGDGRRRVFPHMHVNHYSSTPRWDEIGCVTLHNGFDKYPASVTMSSFQPLAIARLRYMHGHPGSLAFAKLSLEGRVPRRFCGKRRRVDDESSHSNDNSPVQFSQETQELVQNSLEWLSRQVSLSLWLQ